MLDMTLVRGEDDDSFASSIASVRSMKSNPVDNMDAEDFHDAKDGAPKPDKQPDQEGKVIDFIPAEIEVSQTKLITKAVETLEMDSEGNYKADSTEEDSRSGKEGEPGAKDVDNEEQRAYDEKQDEALYDKHPNPESFYQHLWNEAGPNLGAM